MSTAAPGAGRMRRALARLTVGQVLALSIGVLLAMTAVGIVLALVAEERLADRRGTALDEIAPAQTAALRLRAALLDQETGVRGFVLTGEDTFLDPYRGGRVEEDAALAELAPRASGGAFADDLAAVRGSVARWRAAHVGPAIARVRAGREVTEAQNDTGRRLFDAVRADLDVLEAGLERERVAARRDLHRAADLLNVALVVAAVLLVLAAIAAGLALRTLVTRPLARLGRDARRVAAGGFATPLEPVTGPREIVGVRRDVEAMRERIVHDLEAVETARATLEAQTRELERSNADLEQFAYVASHDLQEPLRKIASFCQVLDRRYRGRLDERADQYIEFIVDGAKRMQLLINDLLAFSRVGRRVAGREEVDTGALVRSALRGLSEAVEEAGAVVEADGLPVVNGERALLLAVFQNLIANAIKFRRDDPPVIRIAARPDGDMWEFTVEDNGIGIDPEFGERVFVIFQRLHTREEYEGTGIGLALCRKIIEYHGGRITLDPEYRDGTRFRFTLPRTEDPA